MKKRLFLLFCGVMCLFFVLCSCGDDTENVPTSSSINVGTVPTKPSGGNIDDEPVVFPPETSCEASQLGHYWKNVRIEKNTSSTGSIIIRGVCDRCGDTLGKEAITLVSREEWVSALSAEGLNSFTVIRNDEYTDFDENGSLIWRIKDDVYTQDLFVNSDKNSTSHALNFSAFLLSESYNKFKYDQSSRAYVYEENNTRVELGFADGKLLFHSFKSLSDGSNPVTSVYVNHGRIKIEAPNYLIQSFSKMTAFEKISKSTLSKDDKEKLFNELKALSFDSQFEASYLENGKVSVYFYLENEKTDPFFDQKYSSVTVYFVDDRLSSVSFGNNRIDVDYKD